MGNLVGTIEYDYPAFHLSMDCFWCEVVSGDLVLKEAEAARWLTKDDIDSVPWLPADQTILDVSKVRCYNSGKQGLCAHKDQICTQN